MYYKFAAIACAAFEVQHDDLFEGPQELAEQAKETMQLGDVVRFDVVWVDMSGKPPVPLRMEVAYTAEIDGQPRAVWKWI